MKQAHLLINILLLSFSFSLIGCSNVIRKPQMCAAPKGSPKVTPITGYKLTSDISDNNLCNSFVTKWENVKNQLKSDNIIDERLDVDYNNYDFYKVSISDNASLIEKYNQLITNLTKGFSYKINPLEDEGLKNTCQSIQPPQRKCINCKDDILAINITNTHQHGCNPSHCSISITLCVDQETYTLTIMGDNWEEDITTISDLIIPECMEGLTIKDGTVVFPKPILDCVNKSENINKLCNINPLSKWTNPNSTWYYNPSDTKEQTSINDKDNTENKDNSPSSQDLSSAAPKKRMLDPPEYTKLKLQFSESNPLYHDHQLLFKDYVPSSIDSFLKITVDHYFKCDFE